MDSFPVAGESVGFGSRYQSGLFSEHPRDKVPMWSVLPKPPFTVY